MQGWQVGEVPSWGFKTRPGEGESWSPRETPLFLQRSVEVSRGFPPSEASFLRRRRHRPSPDGSAGVGEAGNPRASTASPSSGRAGRAGPIPPLPEHRAGLAGRQADKQPPPALAMAGMAGYGNWERSGCSLWGALAALAVSLLLPGLAQPHGKPRLLLPPSGPRSCFLHPPS